MRSVVAAGDRARDEWRRTSIRACYTVHYSEPEGFDCGIHCEPNPHVDGLLQYQDTDAGGGTYGPHGDKI
jgi:hypothetical protein